MKLQGKIVDHLLKEIGEEGDKVLVLVVETYGTLATTYKSKFAVQLKERASYPLGGMVEVDMDLTQQELPIGAQRARSKNGAQTELEGAPAH